MRLKKNRFQYKCHPSSNPVTNTYSNIEPQEIITQYARVIPASLPLNARIKGTERICSVNIYDTPCTTMHNLGTGKKNSKENLCYSS